MTDTKSETIPSEVAAPEEAVQQVLPGMPAAEDKPAKTTTPTWKKAVAVAAWVVAAFALFVALGNLRQPESAMTAGVPLDQLPEAIEVAPADSLGIKFDQVAESWNSISQSPSIQGALRRLSEPGALDSFLYRFDSSAELVGAYSDDTDYLAALMVRSDLDNPAVDNMYLHMCQVIDPFSPECIDNYFTIGLGGLTLAEVAETGAEVTWEHEGNTWRVTVTDDDLTIRALAPTG